MAFTTAEVLINAIKSFGNAVNQGDGTTFTEPTGTNRYTVFAVHFGFHSSASPPSRTNTPIPASFTVGGQTVNALRESGNAASEGQNDTYVGIFAANEAIIAAMTFTAGEANWSIQFFAADGTTPLSNDLRSRIVAINYDDFDQTAGVVASGVSTDTDVAQDITLPTEPNDIVIAAGSTRATSTISTADTSRSAGAQGTGAQDVEGLVSEKVATTTSTVITQTFGSGVISAMVALALRPAAAGGGAGSVTRKIVAVVGAP
jgi:hypothetical protein